jgi:hypothetical protein
VLLLDEELLDIKLVTVALLESKLLVTVLVANILLKVDVPVVVAKLLSASIVVEDRDCPPTEKVLVAEILPELKLLVVKLVPVALPKIKFVIVANSDENTLAKKLVEVVVARVVVPSTTNLPVSVAFTPSLRKERFSVQALPFQY